MGREIGDRQIVCLKQGWGRDSFLPKTTFSKHKLFSRNMLTFVLLFSISTFDIQVGSSHHIVCSVFNQLCYSLCAVVMQVLNILLFKVQGRTACFSSPPLWGKRTSLLVENQQSGKKFLLIYRHIFLSARRFGFLQEGSPQWLLLVSMGCIVKFSQERWANLPLRLIDLAITSSTSEECYKAV